jgi:hypothetical protein
MLHDADVFGFLAAAATLMTFWQTQARAMRLWALGANVLFIAYGVLGGHMPPLLLHVILLPLNMRRLMLMGPKTTDI